MTTRTKNRTVKEALELVDKIDGSIAGDLRQSVDNLIRQKRYDELMAWVKDNKK